MQASTAVQASGESGRASGPARQGDIKFSAQQNDMEKLKLLVPAVNDHCHDFEGGSPGRRRVGATGRGAPWHTAVRGAGEGQAPGQGGGRAGAAFTC